MNKVLDWLVVNKDKIYVGIYTIIGIIMIIFMIRIFTPKPVIPKNIQTTLDSLKKENIKIMDNVYRLDQVNNKWQDSIIILNSKINNIKAKQVITNNYYHEKIDSVDHYTSDELDSWLRSRYHY